MSLGILQGNDGKYGLNELLHYLSDSKTSRNHNLEISQGFKKFDIGCNGKISFENLKELNVQVKAGLSEHEMEEMIKAADTNGDGFVGEKEFKEIMLQSNLYR